MTARAPKQLKIGRLRLPNLLSSLRIKGPSTSPTPSIEQSTFSIQNPSAHPIRFSPRLKQPFPPPRKFRPIVMKHSLLKRTEDRWIAGIERFAGTVARWLSPFSGSRLGALGLVMGVGSPGTSTGFTPASQTPLTAEKREALIKSIQGKHTRDIRMKLFDDLMQTPAVADHFDMATLLIVIREHAIVDPNQILDILAGRRSPGILDRIERGQLGQLIRRYPDFLMELERLHVSYHDWVDPFSPTELTEMFLEGVFNSFVTPAFYTMYKWSRRFGTERPMQILFAIIKNDRETILRHLGYYQITGSSANMVTDKLLSFRGSARIKQLTFMIPSFLELTNDEIPAAIAAIASLRLEEASRRLTQYSFIVDETRGTDLNVPIETIRQLWENNIRMDTNTSRHTTLGAIDARMALTSAINRDKILSLTPETLWKRLGIGHMYQHPINPKLTLHFTQGATADMESAAGLSVDLIYDGASVLASLGFLESDDRIAIVKYQGGRIPDQGLRERIFEEFRTYSGGIDPLPWFAHTVGRTLLRRARATEKEFLWIKGERILYGYPHVGVEYPVHLETIEDARRYGEISESVVLGTDIQLADVENQRFALVRKLRETTDPEAQERIKRQLSKLGREMFRLQHQRETYSQSSDRVQKLYDRTAQNLGFRQWGKRPWHRYTKRVDTFGSTIRSRASDPSQFERSEGEMDHAFSFLIPDSD